MSDNVHGVGVNDVAEQIEQDLIKAKTDLITITSSINLDTVGTNQTSFTNQLSGASSSGLKTLIEGNDTDISNINDKLDMNTSSNMKTAIDLNTAKVTFPGIGTTASTCLAGNTTTISATQASKITANENAINAIETKTDFIQVSQNVDLDDMESTIVSNTSSAGVNSANITNILNNTISSTLKTAVDTNSAKVSFPGIGTTASTCLAGNTTTITSTQASNILTNNAKISFPSTLNSLLSVSDTYELEVGSGSGVPRIRLNGANGNATSSEIIFIDATGNNAEYFQGFTLRYNSADNIFQILSDQANNNSPLEALKIDRSSRETQMLKACVYLNEIEAKGGTGITPSNANLMLTTKQGSLPGYSSSYYPTVKTAYSNMYFAVGGNYVGYLTSSNVGQIDFTGQHRAVPANNNLITNLENNIGKIVCSTGEICSLIEDENGIFQPQNTITINESIPKVELSNTYKCKKVFGVISDQTDTENNGEKHYKMGCFNSVIHSLEDDNRLTINSVGEGAILVCNLEGNIENGDLITTSTLEGIGCKQDDDLVHNYTVAKATIDCNFDLNSNNYNCYLDENNNKIAFISCIYLL